MWILCLLPTSSAYICKSNGFLMQSPAFYAFLGNRRTNLERERQDSFLICTLPRLVRWRHTDETEQMPEPSLQNASQLEPCRVEAAQLANVAADRKEAALPTTSWHFCHVSPTADTSAPARAFPRVVKGAPSRRRAPPERHCSLFDHLMK